VLDRGGVADERFSASQLVQHSRPLIYVNRLGERTA
jgi:hypothetical protein